MLKDLKLQSQTLEALCDKAKVFGVINSIEEIHKKKLKNSVLIGKIIEIGKLIRRDGVILRDSFQFLMKELCANGKYGNHFLAILFDAIAIEAHTAKFMLSDKLFFCKPQVFVNPQFGQQKRPRFLVQVGLCHDEDEVVWYSRKHSEESAVIFASPQKKLMKINNNENFPSYPNCSNSNMVVNSVENYLTKPAGKNTRINENNQQTNKDTSVTKKNWISRKNNKNISNIIHKRLLFARNNDAPFLSDSDMFNNNAIQTDPEVSRSPPSLSLGNNNNNNNNNIEGESTVTTCVTGNNRTVISKYFSNKSPVKHEMSAESVMKPVVVSECDSIKDDSSGSQRNKESDTSDFLNILEEVSVAMKLKYLSCADQAMSKNESPKKELDANTNSVEEVTLDTDTDADDPVELTTGTQQCRKILLNNTKTSCKCEDVLKEKKIKSNSGRRTVKPATVLNNPNSMHNKPKHKQVKSASSHSVSQGKAFSSILTLKNSSKNNKCNNDSTDPQALNAEKEKRKKKLKDGAISCVHNRKMVNNKIKESEMVSVEQKTKTNEVRHKHEERLHELEASHTLSLEDNKKMNDSITSNTSAENSASSPNKTIHEVRDGICNDNCKPDITLADKTTPRKLIPALKSPFDNNKQIVGQQHRKKRVSFVLNDEENETGPIGNSKSVLPEDHKARPGIKSVLANDEFADYILNVLLQSSQTDASDNSSTGDCDAVMQGTEKYSTLIRKQFSDTVVSKHVEIGSRDTVESLNVLNDESLSLSPSLLSHSHNTLSADVDNDNSVAVNTTHSDGEIDERSKCDNTVQPVITKEKVLKKLLSGSKKKKVVINAGYITNKSQGSSRTDNTSVADIISEQQRTMITTAAKTIGPCSAQNSVINHVGMKRKLDDKTSCCDDSSEYKSIDLAKIQKYVSHLTPDYSRSSSCMLVEVNWPTMLKRDVGVSTSYSESDTDDCDPDVSGDPEGRWFVLSGASLIDVYPPLSGNALELVSGFCNHNCFHRYSELLWVKNDTGESESVCPTAFKEGIRKPSPVMFLFTFVVTDREGKCYNLRVYKEHAESLLCCKVTDFIMDREKRAQVIASIKSYIATSAAESSILETKNKKKLTLCVYDKGSMQIVVRRVQTSTLKL